MPRCRSAGPRVQQAMISAGSCANARTLVRSLSVIRLLQDVSAAMLTLCSAYDGIVPARGKAILKTDLAIAVPEGTYGRVGAFVLRRSMCVCVAVH